MTSVSATAPLSVSGTTTPTIAIASGSATGQTLNWTGSAWSSSYPNASQLRGVAGVAQIPSNCTAAQTLVYYSPADRYDCTAISISNSNVSGLGGAALLSVGTAAGTVAAGNDSRMVNAIQTSTSAGGDLSGTWSTASVHKIQGITVSSTTPTNGQLLKYDSTSGTFLYGSDSNSGGTVTSITPGTGFTSSTAITGAGTLNVNTGTAANQVVALDSSARLPAVDGSQLTNMPVVPFTTVVSASGTSWTVPAGVKKVFVQVWGGGGGGGGGATVGTGGGGGAGGGYAAGFVDVSAVSSVSVAVGAAGSGGAAGAAGTAGGNSSFGTVSAAGGGAGVNGATVGSTGGSTLVGTITVAGGAGHVGTSGISVLSVVNLLGLGGGGGTAGGGGGLGGSGSLGNATAGPGTTPGGGGGGGGSGFSAGAVGAVGGAGRILVWY